jgi:hypothetical protein
MTSLKTLQRIALQNFRIKYNPTFGTIIVARDLHSCTVKEKHFLILCNTRWCPYSPHKSLITPFDGSGKGQNILIEIFLTETKRINYADKLNR